MPLIMWQILKKIFLWFYKIFRSSFGVISVIMVIGLWSVASYYAISYINGPAEVVSDDYSDIADTGTSLDTTGCNVLGIILHGTLSTYIPPKSDSSLVEDTDVVSSESIIYYLDQARKDENIKAVLVEVDSYGGSPVAAEEVANGIKASTKPTVALIRQAGTSAAYWAATGANYIFASKNSDVGSIGVTQSYLDNINKNAKEGYSFVSLSAGKYKDVGNPDRPLSEEEKAMLLKDLNIIHKNFIETVSVNRKIPLADVQKIADGSSVLGDKAKELHLIDAIGGNQEAQKYLSDKIGGKAEVCWY